MHYCVVEKNPPKQESFYELLQPDSQGMLSENNSSKNIHDATSCVRRGNLNTHIYVLFSEKKHMKDRLETKENGYLQKMVGTEYPLEPCVCLCVLCVCVSMCVCVRVCAEGRKES